jgi:predicted enzyme related to lactoylglutathione lyase
MLNGPNWAGLHHFGFVVDNLEQSQKRVVAEGGQFFMKLPAFPGVDAESKFKDPNGVVFDMSEHDWQQAK